MDVAGERTKGGQSSRHRERIARERASLIHLPRGRHVLHELTTAAIGRHGQATPDHLPEGGEVRGDAKALASAAECDTEAGHNFIEDEQGPRFVSNLS